MGVHCPQLITFVDISSAGEVPWTINVSTLQTKPLCMTPVGEHFLDIVPKTRKRCFHWRSAKETIILCGVSFIAVH